MKRPPENLLCNEVDFEKYIAGVKAKVEIRDGTIFLFFPFRSHRIFFANVSIYKYNCFISTMMNDINMNKG